MIFSGYKFFSEYFTYQKGKDDYREVNEAITVLSEESTDNADESAETSESGESGGEEAEESAEYPALTIDYDELEAENPDFVGVIYIPALELYYPVAHSRDNAEYLTTTFSGKSNPCGSIFLDKNASADLTDLNSFIFGHNMKNETMFGSLKEFLKQDGLCDSDPYVYIYTKDKVYKYHIFSYFVCSVNDSLYNNVSDHDGYDAYVEKCKSRSEYKKSSDTYEDDFSSYTPLITLSTCYATGHVNNFVVAAAQAGVYDIGK